MMMHGLANPKVLDGIHIFTPLHPIYIVIT